jgi:hypothetical protein
VLGNDGHLWTNGEYRRHQYWCDLGGSPYSDTHFTGGVGVVSVEDNMQARRPYAFLRDSDGNLWEYSWDQQGQHFWYNLGPPSTGTSVASGIGAVTVKKSPDAPQRPYAYMLGTDGHLWENQWDGSRHIWTDLGAPRPGLPITGVGVTTIMNDPQAAQRPYVYVVGSDGHLWENMWTGDRHVWTDLGMPAPAVGAATGIGTNAVKDNPSTGQRTYAYVRGTDGHLWENFWNGDRHVWNDLGLPGPRISIVAEAGTTAVLETPGSGQLPYVYVLGSDGHLWANQWTGSSYIWVDLGTPGNEKRIVSKVGVTTIMGGDWRVVSKLGFTMIMGSSRLQEWPYVYVLGSDGDLYLDRWPNGPLNGHRRD